MALPYRCGPGCASGISMAADSEWLAMTDEERSRVRCNAPMVRKERRAAALSNAASARPNVIIDLAFDQFMTDQQVASLARQLCLNVEDRRAQGGGDLLRRQP